MRQPESHSRLRVELFVRSSTVPSTRDRQAAVKTTLESILGDAVAVTNWPKRVPLDADVDETVPDVVPELRAWATEADVDLSPAFDTRQCYSWVTGEAYESLVLPVMLLAIYEESDLVDVYPRMTAQGVESVSDGIDRLRTEGSDRRVTRLPGPADD